MQRKEFRTLPLRSRLAAALAAAALFMVLPVIGVGGVSAQEAQEVDNRPRTLTLDFQRVRADGQLFDSDVAHGDFTLRLFFRSVGLVDVTGYEQDILQITDGSVVSVFDHSRYSGVKYWLIRPDDGANEVTVAVAEGAVEDSNGNTNSAGSFSINTKPPLTVALTTEAQEPVLGGSIRVDIAVAHDVLFKVEHTETEQTHQFVVNNSEGDFRMSHGRIVRWPQAPFDVGIGREFHVWVGGYGSYVGNIQVTVPAEAFRVSGDRDAWNRASNVLEVWVGTPFTVTGVASAVYADRSSTLVSSYGVTNGNATVAWSLTGDDSDAFVISDSGTLSFASVPASNGSYKVTVNATSDDYAGRTTDSYTATLDVAISAFILPNNYSQSIGGL